MSTIVSSFLKDRATSKQITTEMSIEGTAKAWAVWNGVTMAVSRTFNISSITDAGVGNWQPLFTAVFDGPYSGDGSAHSAGSFWAYISMGSMSAGGLPVTTYNIAASTVAVDANHVCCTATGRLA